MDYTITNIKDWNADATIQKLIKERGLKAGKKFATCMMMLTSTAEKSSLLDELNDRESLVRIGIKKNGKPTVITYGYGCVHQYTFSANEVHHKTLADESDFIKFRNSIGAMNYE